MMSGITSPSRPWFRLTTPDPDLAQFGSAKEWLHFVTTRMSARYHQSNLYNVLPTMYGDGIAFGTGTFFLDQDPEEIIRAYSFPVGSYYIAVDAKGRVNTFMREFSQTIRQIVEKFGRQNQETGRPDWSNISSHVKTLYENGEYNKRVNVIHLILPNEKHDPRRPLSELHKKYLSLYYEWGGQVSNYESYSDLDRSRFLRIHGYDYFPVLSMRWEITGDDAYGSNCPGMEALGDIMGLQRGELRVAEAIEKLIRPPMKGPSDILNQIKSILPGGFTADNSIDPNGGLRPVFQVDPRIQEMEHKQEQTRQRIRRAFYEDLFLMMSQSDRREITAREIDERREEKLLALGPVLERTNDDVLDRLIDNTFQFMLERGEIPDPPEELQGVPLKIEYISIMAQAQKMIGLAGVDRYLSFVAGVHPIYPDIVYKVDFDEMANEVAESVGVSPKINRTKERVEEIKALIAQSQQAQVQMQLLEQGAKTAKALSQIPTEGNNALNELIRGVRAAEPIQ